MSDSSHYTGYDINSGPMFEFCCPSMQNNYNKAIRYSEARDKFQVAWRPNENLELEYLTDILYCPYCGKATSERNIVRDDRIAKQQKPAKLKSKKK